MLGAEEQGERVLVVDDDCDVRSALARGLKRLGYEVLQACDGEDALVTVSGVVPEVIITDLRMPRLDGHTLLRRLQSQSVPSAVIVISAHGTMDDVVDALRQGAVDYLKKPFTSAELAAAVGRGIEVFGQRQRLRGDDRVAVATSRAPTPPPTPPEAEDGAFDGVLELIRKGEIVVPPVPSVISELRGLVHKPDATIDGVASRIERDQRLAAEVLRVASSPVYMGSLSQGGTSVRTAVSRLGFRFLQNLVETVWSKSVFQAPDPALRILQLKVWRFSVARAMAMRAVVDLAVHGTNLDGEAAYAAGLLSDVGASFLLWLAGERARAGKPLSEAACLEGIRRQHEVLGAALIESWKLDANIVQAARLHHAETPPAPPELMWHVAVVSTAIADELAPGDDVTHVGHPRPATIDRAMSELRLAPSAVKTLTGTLQIELLAVLSALGT